MPWININKWFKFSIEKHGQLMKLWVENKDKLVLPIKKHGNKLMPIEMTTAKH